MVKNLEGKSVGEGFDSLSEKEKVDCLRRDFEAFKELMIIGGYVNGIGRLPIQSTPNTRTNENTTNYEN